MTVIVQPTSKNVIFSQIKIAQHLLNTPADISDFSQCLETSKLHEKNATNALSLS